MRHLASLGLALIAYLVVAGLLFGSVLSPIWLATRWSDHLGIPLWRGIAVVTAIFAAYLSFRVLDKRVPPIWRHSVFVASSLILSTLLVGGCADVMRQISLARFAADRTQSHSFFVSIRNAPRDFQTFVHTAALKACVPYAWSYREMSFYKLAPDVAVNVLPPDWIKTCSIQRENPDKSSCDRPSCYR